MGASPALQAGAVRASFGWSSTDADIDALIAAAAQIARKPEAA
jgi:cysteine sulfinate desulfinase/cysteine desulfurase-like protein